MRVKTLKMLVLAVIFLAAIIVVAPMQNQNLNTLMCQNLSLYLNCSTSGPVSIKTIVWDDKIVTGTEIYNSEEIVLNGNLIITSGGSLTLTGVILKVNCTANGSSRIEVQNGGKLYINDTDGNPDTRNDASNITALNPSYRFLFWVQSGATFQMNNSELHYCGYAEITPENCGDHCGLWINTNSTIMERNYLSNNYCGIILYDAHHNIIRNNTVTSNNLNGFCLCCSSNNTLSGNTAKGSTCSGFLLCNSWLNDVKDNTAINSGYGFRLEKSSSNTLCNNKAVNSTIQAYCLDEDSVGNDLTGSTIVNYLRVKVRDWRGVPVQGADVKVEVDGSIVYASSGFGGSNSTTDENGLTGWIPVAFKTYLSETTSVKNRTRITVAYGGFSINNFWVIDMSTSHTETFIVNSFTSNIDPEILLPTLLLLYFASQLQNSFLLPIIIITYIDIRVMFGILFIILAFGFCLSKRIRKSYYIDEFGEIRRG